MQMSMAPPGEKGLKALDGGRCLQMTPFIDDYDTDEDDDDANDDDDDDDDGNDGDKPHLCDPGGNKRLVYLVRRKRSPTVVYERDTALEKARNPFNASL